MSRIRNFACKSSARKESAPSRGSENAGKRKGKERKGKVGRVESHGWGWVNGGPCNDLTAVVTFLISARFNYTVEEEGAHSLLPPLELLQARARIPPGRLVGLLASQPPSSFHHSLHLRAFLINPSQGRPGQSFLTRYRLANKI